MRLCDRSIFSTVVAQTVSNLVSLEKLLFIAILFEDFMMLVSQSEFQQQSLVQWLRIAKLSGEILMIGSTFTKSCTYIVQYLCVELWMFKCAVVGCAVVKAIVVSDADNKRKTCATWG